MKPAFETTTPKTVEEAADFLIKWLEPEDTKRIKGMTLNQFTGVVHHGLGTMMRNGWSLWVRTTPVVGNVAKRFGTAHGDDVSGLIFVAFFSKVTGRPYSLEAQGAGYRRHWRKLGVDPLSPR